MTPEHDRQKTCSAPSKKRGPSKSDRRKAADDAGISRSQAWRALQVAKIPEDEFERLIKSDNPPTVSALVGIGTGKELLPTVRRCPHCGAVLERNRPTTTETAP